MNVQRQVILIFGQTGSGKTTIARNLFVQSPRALVAEADFGEFEAQVFDTFEELVLYLDEQRAFSETHIRPYRFSNTAFRVSYTPLTTEHPLVFETALELGNLALYLEEADRFDDPKIFPEYDEVITRGRHYGISIVAIGLHPFKIPKELRRQATKIITFRQIDPADINWLSEIMGEIAFKASELRTFEKIVWTPTEGGKILNPQETP